MKDKDYSYAIPKRHHTRAEVEAFVIAAWRRVCTDEEQFEVTAIELVLGLGSPVWLVSYRFLAQPGTRLETWFHSKYLLTEHHNVEGTYGLHSMTIKGIPVETLTILEENRALKKFQ